MKFNYLHESEDVQLVSEQLRPSSELWELFVRYGFTLHGEVFSFDRPKKTKISPWQSKTIVAVYIFQADQDVYDSDEQWNRITLRYLLATLPRELISVFVEKAEIISRKLNLPLLYQGRTVLPNDLSSIFNSLADELSQNIASPGGEDLAIVIESTYPRR